MSLQLMKLKMAARKKAAIAKAAAAQQPAPTTPVSKLAEAFIEAGVKEEVKPVGQLNKNEVTYNDLNDEQKLAVTLAGKGKSFCLIGGAGAGKTTTTRSVVQKLFESGQIGKLTSGTEKLFETGAPSVAILSFTNQAVRNIASAVPKEFKGQCSTFHNAVEYHPDYFEVEKVVDGEWTGEYTSSMRFIPRYGLEGSTVENMIQADKQGNVIDEHGGASVEWFVEKGDGMGCGEVLPHLDVVVVEEGGSVPRELFYTFMSALPRPQDTTFIFLGDLNQLPPVFDDAILGFMLLALPVIELSTLYRNVGLVTKVAQRLLTGKPIRDTEATKDFKDGGLSGTDESGTVLFKPFGRHVDWEIATPSLGRHLKEMVVAGDWDEKTSVVLVPQNVKLGQDVLNKWIGQGIAERDGLDVYHITFNGQNKYLCIGDKVLYNKRYRRIIKIEPNTSYKGKKPLPPSKWVNRWGTIDRDHEEELLGGLSKAEYENEIDVDAFLDSYTGEELAVGQQSSGIVTMVLDDSELDPEQLEHVKAARASGREETRYSECTAKGAGDLNNMLPVYAMTVHKAQGSEWLNVLMILHRSHGKMLQRELLYTGMTRARTNLTVWYSGEDKSTAGASALSRGVLNQAIKGKTLEAKLDYFRNKLKVEATKAELMAQAERKAAAAPNAIPTPTGKFIAVPKPFHPPMTDKEVDDAIPF